MITINVIQTSDSIIFEFNSIVNIFFASAKFNIPGALTHAGLVVYGDVVVG